MTLAPNDVLARDLRFATADTADNGITAEDSSDRPLDLTARHSSRRRVRVSTAGPRCGPP
ncbi:hypothetical protein DUI70_0311 [Streptomyces albus]|nr:hypothetical protein DUI70_0311 [Streptomyces albus]